jgi:archaetidylinositol phosphate synthase
MLETHLRKYVQPACNTLGCLFISVGLTPDKITLLAFISGILSAVALALHYTIFALLFLWISGFLDIMDGTVARITQKAHAFGAYSDLIADRMVESALMVGFTFAYSDYYLAYITFLIALLFHFSTFLAAGALFKNEGPKSMHYDRSLVERAEAFVVFSAMMLFPTYIFPLLMTFNLFIFGSGISRYIRVYRDTKKDNDS